MTPEDKNAALTAAILNAITNGATVEEAVDAILGAGTYADVASRLYDALRSQDAR